MEQPNLSYISSMSGGDKAFEDKLIAIIKEEFPKEKDVYFKNLEAKKFKETAENVHKLKHKISILGLEESYKIAEDFEDNLKKQNVLGYKIFNAILQNITDYLKTL